MRTKYRIKNSDIAVMGDEPNLPGKIYGSKLSVALNWYNYFHDIKHHKKWVGEYMKWKKYSSSDINTYMKSSDTKTTSTMCAIARMLTRGSIFENNLDNQIKEILASTKPEKKIIYFKKAENKAITDLDTIIDIFIMDGYKGKFEVDSIIARTKQTDIPQAVIYYQELYDELICDESHEMYDHLNTRQLNRYRELVKSFIDALKFTRVQNKRVTQRKPRKKKVKTAQQITSKVKYQQSDNTLGVVSIDPSKIVESTVIWTYNTKYRKLAKYVSKNGPFVIKGTTIQNFCEKQSIQKTVRKPKDTIKLIVSDGKTVVDKMFTKMASKQSKPNGRINNNTLILRAFK